MAKVFYNVRKDVLREQYVTKATWGTGAFHAYVDDTALAPEVRAALWDCGAASGRELTIPTWDGEWGVWRAVWRASKEYQSGVELIHDWYADYVAARDEALAARDEARAAALVELRTYLDAQEPGTFVNLPPYQYALRKDLVYTRAYEDARAWALDQRKVAEARRAEEERAYEEEKRAFVAGPDASEDLRRRYAGGYDCDLQYAQERAAIEHPGYAVYHADLLAWHYRHAVRPSASALAEAQKAGGRVVQMDHWNVHLPHGEVILLPYLWRFSLFRAARATEE